MAKLKAFKEKELPKHVMIPPGITDEDLARMSPEATPKPKVLPIPYRGTPGFAARAAQGEKDPALRLLPSVEEVARGLIGFYKSDTEDFPNDFFKAVEKGEQEEITQEEMGIPIETIGFHDYPPDPYQGLSIFLQIPWREFEKRAEIEEFEGQQEWVDTTKINDEIMYPAAEIVEKAFEMIKPPHINGKFKMDFRDDCGCLLIYYVPSGILEWMPGEEE